MRLLPFILLASFLLAACGTKGPLYIPEKKFPQTASPSNQAPKQTEKANFSQPVSQP